MPKAKYLFCTFCGKGYYATRSDSLYCSEKCLRNNKHENRKFETPQIPKSGIEGISYNRFRRAWELRLNVEGKQKYLFGDKNLENVKVFRQQFLGS